LLISLFAAVPLALSACGGGKSSDSSSSSTATPTVAGATGTGGASGTSGATGRSGAGATGAGTKKRSSGGSGTGGSSTASGPTGGTNQGKTQSKAKSTPEKPKKPKFLPGSFVGQANLLYKQSKIVCHALTLDGLAHEYNVTPKTPAAVARRYAQAYPPSIRRSVYRGCKAGLS
jgi:hypothetical protein